MKPGPNWSCLRLILVSRTPGLQSESAEFSCPARSATGPEFNLYNLDTELVLVRSSISALKIARAESVSLFLPFYFYVNTVKGLIYVHTYILFLVCLLAWKFIRWNLIA
jgi:hypothetical protein